MAETPEPMTSEDLLAWLTGQVEDATGGWNSVIAQERARLMREYNAEPYGDEVEGRSQFVPSDIKDTVGWIMPDLMEVFTGGELVVEAEPVGEEDEEAASQESDVLNHLFMERNGGFEVLWCWFSDALTQINGTVKCYWDTDREVSIEGYERLTMDEMVKLHMDFETNGQEATIIGHTPGTNTVLAMIPGPDGLPTMQPQEIEVHQIKVRVVTTRGTLVVEPVPPEEFFITPRWKSLDLRGCPLSGQRTIKTRSDLIKTGYDPVQVRDLASGGDDIDSSPERQQRFSGRAWEERDLDQDDIEVVEAYALVDADGDGIAEMRRIVYAGNEILRWADGREDNEEVDYNPFVSLTPRIVAHRFHGECVADDVSDLQRLRAAHIRAMNDQTYLATFPPREISRPGIGEFTIEDLLNITADSIVRTELPGQLREMAVPPVSPVILQQLDYIEQMRRNRTGVMADGQGTGKNALIKTATEATDIRTLAQKKVTMIARTFAETGVKLLFQKMHRLWRRYGDQTLAVKLRNKWVSVNPREWKDRTDFKVSVGLGSGSKAERVAMLEAIYQRQKELLPLGLCTLAQIKATNDKLIQVAGYRNPDAFFSDPPENPPPAPPTELEIMAMAEQAKAAAAETSAEIKREEMLMKDANDDAKREMDFAIEVAKLKAQGIEVDMVTLQSRIDASRIARLRAERDAEVDSQIRLTKAQQEIQGQAQQAQMQNGGVA